ncbi:MAG: mechanosensitive ion channel family protein [Elusimicrobiota bacterium]
MEYLRQNPNVANIVISSILVFTVYLLARIAKYKARKTQEKLNLDKSRYLLIKRLISMFSFLFIFAVLIFVWGINLKQVWLTLSGVAAMVAIAFFAIWSLLGNILAGVLLYFTAPFRINDNIEVSPDGITGKVIAINTFYTVLMDEDEAFICIPNTLFFQKYIKNYKDKGRKS